MVVSTYTFSKWPLLYQRTLCSCFDKPMYLIKTLVLGLKMRKTSAALCSSNRLCWCSQSLQRWLICASLQGLTNKALSLPFHILENCNGEERLDQNVWQDHESCKTWFDLGTSMGAGGSWAPIVESLEGLQWAWQEPPSTLTDRDKWQPCILQCTIHCCTAEYCWELQWFSLFWIPAYTAEFSQEEGRGSFTVGTHPRRTESSGQPAIGRSTRLCCH